MESMTKGNAAEDEYHHRANKQMIDLNVELPTQDDCQSAETDFENDSDFIECTLGNDVNVRELEVVVDQTHEVVGDQPGLVLPRDPLHPPSVGMTFKSHDDVIMYYHEFGRQNGFQIKIRSRDYVKGVESSNNVEYKRLRLVCSKEGKFASRGKDPSKPVRTQLTGCKAKITATLDKSGEWKLTTAVLEHNHTLDPLDSRFMPNYRVIDSHNKEIILTNERAGVPISRNFTTFAVRYGGFNAIPFSEKDCRNLVGKHRRLCLQEGDFAAMEKHFLEMSCRDVNFFYMYDTDDNGTLRNVFWADGRCRAAYRDFGDVISFDTTYLKNRYRMPFSPFIGVNHHGQSILLGCALLSGEETSNYIWLMKTWLACMSGKAPRGIMTDQCMAIGNAIKEVLPQTKHRWCIWHIMRNAKKHLDHHVEKENFHKDLRYVLHDSLTVDEFEERWGEMLEKYGLQENSWLDEMYSLRHRWVPIYFKNDFWAGMSSTQRSEGMNNFFKSFVNLNTTLKEFVEQYSLALGKRANDEESETFRSINKPTQCFTEFVAECVFQRLYTSKKFEEFQEQVRQVTYTNATKIKDDGSVRLYDVVIKKKKWPHMQRFTVTLDRVSFSVKCECKNFEFKGILCSHIIRVWHEEDVSCVPEKYILSRWRKDFPRDYLKILVPYYTPENNPEANRYLTMQKLSEEIANMARVDEKAYSVVLDFLSKLRSEVRALVGKGQELPQSFDTIGKVYGRRSVHVCEDGSSHIPNTIENNDKVKDPIDRRCRGRKPSRRKGYETGQSSKRSKKDRSDLRKQDQNELIKMQCGVLPNYSTNIFNRQVVGQRLNAHGSRLNFNPPLQVTPVFEPGTSSFSVKGHHNSELKSGSNLFGLNGWNINQLN